MAKNIYPGSTTDRAAQIRAALKAKGWNSRDVSVRAEYYSMGSSLYVTIKNPTVPVAVVEAIANDHERIDRDQFGDILSGGNRFVYVKYSDDAVRVLSAPFLSALSEAAKAVDTDRSSTSLHPIADTGFLLGRGYAGYGYSLWKDGHIQTANSVEYLAPILATKLQEVHV